MNTHTTFSKSRFAFCISSCAILYTCTGDESASNDSTDCQAPSTCDIDGGADADGNADTPSEETDAEQVIDDTAEGTGANQDVLTSDDTESTEASTEGPDDDAADLADSIPEDANSGLDALVTDTPIADRCRAYWDRSCELLVADEPCNADWAQFWNQYLPDLIPEFTVEACATYMYDRFCVGAERSERRGFASLDVVHVETCLNTLPTVDCEAMQTYDGCGLPLPTGRQDTGEPCLEIHDCVATGETCLESFPLSLPDPDGLPGTCGPPVESGGFCRGAYDCGYGVFCLQNVCTLPEDVP
jgi:hypothetical protein